LGCRRFVRAPREGRFMTPFAKTALTSQQQVDLLRRRGMRIVDTDRARRQLDHISYYRLRAYWLPFEETTADDGDHRFREGTNLETVIAIYDFDRRLRLHLMDAIERIEISLRARISNVLTVRYGAFVHEDASRFADRVEWQRCMDELTKEYQRSRETFAAHYRSRYAEMTTPPLWVACELMTLGHLSRWLKNIRAPRDRQSIADVYGIDERVLVSFAHHLTIVRNHCAHHGRVWNRKLSLKMLVPAKKPLGLAEAFNPSADRYVYNTLTMLAHLLSRISPESLWTRRLIDLLIGTPQAELALMGFPADWLHRTVWQGGAA
jgi:abortive infection bacteriophage resistance protein